MCGRKKDPNPDERKRAYWFLIDIGLVSIIYVF